MFKAVHAETNKDIISIDAAWTDRVDLLRSLDRQNKLLCQGCREPVRLKAGTERVRHFAHKHRANCPLSQVSPEVLLTRALLYERLQSQYGDRVTIEKVWDHGRPIDCFVDNGARGVAYWVIDRGIRPEDRYPLIDNLKKEVDRVHWIFVATMRRPLINDPTLLTLTTTERDLMAESSVDIRIQVGELVRGKSLQYVDHESGILHTQRFLKLVHGAQVFSSDFKTSPLSEVVIAQKTGELAHPGEHEHFLAVKEELNRLKEQRRVAAEREAVQQRAVREAEAERQARIAKLKEEMETALLVIPQPGSYRQSPPSPTTAVYEPRSKVGTCLICGQRTTDWWYFQNGMCKCNDCKDAGRTADDNTG